MTDMYRVSEMNWMSSLQNRTSRIRIDKSITKDVSDGLCRFCGKQHSSNLVVATFPYLWPDFVMEQSHQPIGLCQLCNDQFSDNKMSIHYEITMTSQSKS